MSSIVIDDDGHGLDLDGFRFNRFWLRDLCPSLPTKESGLRTFSVATLPVDLAIAAVDLADGTLVIDWSDNHRSEFAVDQLLQLGRQATGESVASEPVRLFDANAQPEVFDAEVLVPGRLSHHDLLTSVAVNGFAIVRGLDSDATEWLASFLGHIRDTDFGRLFDIVTEPEAWTLSQSNLGQDPHTDDPFRYTPSGISILHCVRASSDQGGRSLIVDGFKVAEDLRADDPGAFWLLGEVAIPFIRHRSESVDQGEDVSMIAHAPVLTLVNGEVVGVRFHERSTGVFDLDPSIVDDYYLAFRAFAERVRDPAYQYDRRLVDGEAIVFDNQRVLHGRTGYQGDAAGRRHLRLCTVDRDQAHSRLRRVRESLGLPGADTTLRSGATAR